MLHFFERLTTWDQKIIYSIISWRGNILNKVMRAVSMLGDGYFYVIIAALMYFSIGLTTSWLFVTVVAFGIELIFYKLIKSKTTRPRPYQVDNGIQNLIIPADQYSFPSGHTAAATVAAVAFSMAVPMLAPLFILMTGLIGLSRVYLGVHYPSDIVFGFVLGLFSISSASLIVLAFQ